MVLPSRILKRQKNLMVSSRMLKTKLNTNSSDNYRGFEMEETS